MLSVDGDADAAVEVR